MINVLVAGGGPAGCMAARMLAKDLDVTIVEEHKVSGIPIQCTGLISDDVVDLAGVDIDVLNSLYGANVHFPNGGTITARSKERKAVLIDRSALDQKLADAAQDAGAVFQYGTKYLEHAISENSIIAKTSSGTFTSNMLIGADGHNSAVSRSLNDNEAKEYVRGIQVDLRHTSDDQEMLDIYVGSEYAPGFFAWVIPFADRTRVGLCSSFDSLPPSEYLKNVLKRAGLQNAEVVDKHSGRIPLGGRKRTYGDNLLLIGDAAGQVKPISGGGLFPAFKAAPCLYETVKEAFLKNDFSSNFLKIYEKRWKNEVEKELRNGYRLRRIFKRMDDRSFDDIHEIMERDDVKNVLNNINIDDPSSAAKDILKNLSVTARMLPVMIGAMIRGVR